MLKFQSLNPLEKIIRKSSLYVTLKIKLIEHGIVRLIL